MVSNIDYVFEPSTNYDFKVTFNKVSGQMDVFINDIFVTTWTDSTPLNSGDYVSFRSGNCSYTVDDFRIYKLRNSNQLITVSADVNSDIRYESSASAPFKSGMIRSIVIDPNKYLSNIAEEKFDVNHTINQASSRHSNDDALFSLNIYPNPSQHLFNISASMDENGILKIYNGKGQLILNKTIQANTRITHMPLEESMNWHKGIYFVQLISKEKVISQKIIKK